MNSFQWDLRYPPATEVNGFHSPEAAGGLDYTTNGPMATPGTYSVVLSVGDQQTRQTFEVGLDPRLHATAEDLDAEFTLTRQIQDDMNSLDTALNQAIAARDKLASRHDAQAAGTLESLNAAIDSLVQMNMRSSEGDAVHTTKLHEWLAYLASDVGIAWARPTAAEYAVFHELDSQTKAAEQKLTSLTGLADKAGR